MPRRNTNCVHHIILLLDIHKTDLHYHILYPCYKGLLMLAHPVTLGVFFLVLRLIEDSREDFSWILFQCCCIVRLICF